MALGFLTETKAAAGAVHASGFEIARHRAGEVKYMELSIAAKAYFFLGQHGKDAKPDELVRLANRFGWTITEKEVDKAVQFLSDLELATMTA